MPNQTNETIARENAARRSRDLQDAEIDLAAALAGRMHGRSERSDEPIARCERCRAPLKSNGRHWVCPNECEA